MSNVLNDLGDTDTLYGAYSDTELYDAKLLAYLHATGRGNVARIIKSVTPKTRELAEKLVLTEQDIKQVRARLAAAHKRRREQKKNA